MTAHLDAEDRKALGGIARAALAAALKDEPYAPADPGRAGLERRSGCFVTLKTDGQLRGCLGCFESGLPLWQTVAEYAELSARHDPRFTHNRLKPADLDRVEMDISALTPLEPCSDPEKIVLGTHGIYVRKNGRSGCFLPQVATETGWNVEEFWGHCCRDKAGLEWNSWREPQTLLKIFTAEVFDC